MIKHDISMNRYMKDQIGDCTVVSDITENDLNVMYMNKKHEHYIVCKNNTSELLKGNKIAKSIAKSSGMSMDELKQEVTILNKLALEELSKHPNFPGLHNIDDEYIIFKCKRITDCWSNQSQTCTDTICGSLQIPVDEQIKTSRIRVALSKIETELKLSDHVKSDLPVVKLVDCIYDVYEESIYAHGNCWEWFDMESVNVLHAIERATR